MAKRRVPGWRAEVDEKLSVFSLTSKDLKIAFAIGVLSFILYAYTAAPSLTVEDSGDFITGIATGGVVHPSGYPLYCILAKLFCSLPFLSLPYQVNLFSGFCGSVTLSLAYGVFRLMGAERLAAAFAAGALALSGVFWEYCGVAETYTLNTALIAATLLFVLKYNWSQNVSDLTWASLLAGLGLSNHYPLFVPCFFVFFGVLSDKKALIQNAPRLSFALILGLTPYLYLFMLAYKTDVPYKFLHLSSFGDVIRHVMRKHYSHGDGGDFLDSVLLTLKVLRELLAHFSLASLLLVFGWVVSFKNRWNFRTVLNLGLFLSSGALIFITYFKNNDYNYAFIRKYMLPFYLLSSCFLSYGITYLQRNRRYDRLLIWILPILLLVEGVQNFSTSNHHDDVLIKEWALATLNHLAPRSVLILCGPDAFALHYFHKVEGVRPDVMLYDHLGIFTENLYEVPIWKLPDGGNIRAQKLGEFLKKSTRPTYLDCTSLLDEFNLTYQVTAFGYRVQTQALETSAVTPEVPLSRGLLDGLFHAYPQKEFWQDRRRISISTRLFNYFSIANPSAFQSFLIEFEQSKFFSDLGALAPIAQNMRLLKREKLAHDILEQEKRLSRVEGSH